MDTTISLEQYPMWYIGFCLLAGLIGALLLYFKDNTFKEASRRQRWFLLPIALFRFLAISAIAFLLLTPLIKNKLTDIVKRTVVIMQDNSASIRQEFGKGDSAALASSLTNLEQSLGEQFRVETYHFGDKLEKGFDFNFNEKTTNLSDGIEEISNLYANQYLAAVVMATDGIYNQGSNPVYSTARMDVPIYAVALGDTTPQKDLLIERVLNNKIAYLGDKFTIRVDLSATNCKGNTTSINIYQGKGNGTKITSKAVSIKSEDFSHSEEFTLSTSIPGIIQYNIELNRVNGEVTTQNNRQTIFIEVLDNRQKILLLAASPHPDIAAIRQSMEQNRNYETKVAYINNFKESVKNYDLVILHGIPSQRNTADEVLEQIKANQIPAWYIVTNQTAISNLNNAQSVMRIDGTNVGTSNDVRSQLKNNFTLFTVDEELLRQLQNLPPIIAPFGKFAASPTTQTLLKQKIGSVSTEYPLLAMEQAQGYKVAVFNAEGLWRWRLFNYKQFGNHNAFDELISKTVQYLSVKNDKRKFRVNIPKTLFNENENVTFDAELYNDSYELVNEPEVNLNVFDENGKSFPFVFTKIGKSYALDAGFFPVGTYTWKAMTALNGKEYSAEGRFSVAPIQLESLQTTADHGLMYSLAKQYGGAVVYPDSVSRLSKMILANPDLKPLSFSSFKTKPIINLKWLFGLILGLLALEWFVRKFLGGY